MGRSRDLIEKSRISHISTTGEDCLGKQSKPKGLKATISKVFDYIPGLKNIVNHGLKATNAKIEAKQKHKFVNKIKNSLPSKH